MAKHGSRYRTSALAALQPRSRRETVFLIGILIIATFFIVRICQFRSLTPRGNTITAVLSTTQVVRGKHGPDGEDEPTAVFTEVFIDSGSGEGFKRPRKQPDVQVKYDNQRKPSLQKSALGSNKADALSDVSKGTAQENRSDSSDRSVQRRSAVDAQQLDGLRTKLDPQSGVLPANISSSVITDNSKSVNSQVIAANSLAGQQERTAQKRVTDKVPSAQNAQQAMLQQSQGDKASSMKVLPSLLDPKPVVVASQTKTLPTVQKALPQSPPPPPPVTRQRITSAPADFDWQTYLLYNPELRDAGIGTQQQAEEHYVQKGYAQGLIYKRLRVLLRYTACTGLINQHYSHIAAFSLCAVLGAELVLPPAVKRDSFAHYFSVFKEHNEVKWTPAPLESLLNVDKIVEFWRGRGLTVHRTPALLPFPDLTQPELAYPMYPQPEIDPELIARIDDVYLRNLDMPELIEKARIAVIGHAGKLLRQDPGRKIDYIVLDMPCTFFMLRSLSNLRVVTEVARSLEFSDQVANLADRVIHGMTMGGKNEYNAVHLRPCKFQGFVAEPMAQAGRQSIISSNLWVLEYLLEQDKVEDELIKHFYDGFLCDVGELPPPIQVRLMLRVLRDNVANITQSSLDALNCLTNFSHESPDLYPPACRVEDLSPALELYVQVKTDLVLRSLREAGGVLLGPAVVSYNALVDKYFPQPPSESESTPLELHRREELKEALISSDKAQELLHKYSLEALGESLLAYVTKARAALGPPLLKVLETDVATGRYMPYMTGSESALGSKRGRGPDAVGDLQQHSKQLRMLGQDPLPATLHQAQLAGLHQGQFSQALQAAVGEQVAGGVLVGGEGGRPVYWDSPQATPDGVKMEMPVAPGMVAPLDGTPDDQGLNGTSEGGKKNKSGGPRRKVGRWSEEETNTLISLTNQLGKGKWKKILDEAGDVFKSRSQVDLKDKWRNLERQGIVQAPVKAEPASGDTVGESAAEPIEQQQGGGEVIENSDAPEAPDNPDGYLAEEGGAGAEASNDCEAMPAKV